MFCRFAIGFIFMFGCNAYSAYAQQNTNNTNKLEQASPTIQDFALSMRLKAYGMRNRDTLAMILAAEMRKKLKLRPAKQAVNDQNGNNVVASTNEAAEITAILKWAEKYAAGNETYLELIKDVRFTASKGKSDGPAFTLATIKPGSINTIAGFHFEAGKYAEIYVEGSKKTNLDLMIYNVDGKLVCSDTDMSNISYCGWTPASGGIFKITIINQSNQVSRYSLISN